MKGFAKDGVRVDITLNVTGNPPGKLADAELHFIDGPLAGMGIIGFGVWQKRERPTEISVTMPSRQFTVRGEKRSYNLVRVSDPKAPADTAPDEEKKRYYAPLNRTRRLITEAYQNAVSAPADTTAGPDAASEEDDNIPF